MEPYFFVKHKYFLICLIPNLMVLFGYYENYIKRDNKTIFRKSDMVNASSYTEMKYLVETKNCKIPDIDPLNSDVWPYYRKEDYQSCTTLGLLTYIEKIDTDLIYLKINQSLLSVYSPLAQISCCYSNISRGSDNDIDNSVSFSECQRFSKSGVEIPTELIKVTCTADGSEVYSNIHSIVREREELVERQYLHPLEDPYSILLFGIDTMSQLNLERTMPKTYSYLEQNDWINLKGYNKIDDNTFPNLMAIMSGMNLSQIQDKCDPENTPLNTCDILWNRFRDHGYVTSYGEDEGYLNSFSYLLAGFDEPPTDFYFRPYFLAIETLEVVKKYFMSYCTGPETSGERILNAIKDFTETLKDYPQFGLFWMNTFSHNDINTASGMDDVFLDFIDYTMKTPALDRTIMVFFSDHGFRFGKIRYTYSGWLEERLPFIYIRIPKSFQLQFPKKYETLKKNTRKLTTPFDVYMTLQEILSISSPEYKSKKSLACPKCHSLFERVDSSRSCADVSISQHLCTCMGHFYIDPNSRIVKMAAYFALDKLRSTVGSFKEGTLCADYYLRNVVSSGITETFYNTNNESFNYLLIIFETFPKAVFEATVSITYQNSIPLFSLQGIISRVDRYGKSSECVSDRVLRKYCYCDGVYTRFKKTLNILFNS